MAIYIAWTFKMETVPIGLSRKNMLDGYFADVNGQLLIPEDATAFDPNVLSSATASVPL